MDYVVPIITAVLSAGVSLAVCLITNHAQNEKTRALLEYKVDELIKRQDKHNSVIERVYELEKAEKVLSEKMSVANHRIEDLERRNG